MTRQALLDSLAILNRPPVFNLLERTADAFAQSPQVTHLSVRGSLSTGTADRMSDIDFVVGVRDSAFRAFIQVLDALMETGVGAIFPGWSDTIVGRMGGLGYVYLVGFDGKLHQLDLYVVPASRVTDVQHRTGSRTLYEPPPEEEHPLADASLGEFIERHATRRPACGDLLIEILVLAQMLRKRILRGQHFLVYAETHLLAAALKDLIKEALAPASTSWGWYHLDEDVGVTPIGRECLAHLSTLLASPPLRTLDDLRRIIDQIFVVVRRASPETMRSFTAAIDAYRTYLELS